MSALLQLAERCEKATDGGWSLDCDIALAIGSPVPSTPTGGGPFIPSGYLPRYSVSLDAAMQLVPEGVCWRVIAWPKNTRGFKAGALIEGSPDAGGATPALALCAASLRARAATEAANG